MRRTAPESSTPAPEAKRRRVGDVDGSQNDADGSASTDAYKEGSVIRVTLTNFLTYDQVVFRPGPRLNVVIGPNGTGKSTIVAALALGLGAAPSILGKDKNLSSFVKIGSSVGMIEIELKGKNRNVIIRRDIKKQSNESTWTVNGTRAGLAEVQKRVSDLNIQLDNLVQFLPQERVSDFAGLDHAQLLKSTEVAVGGNELKELHVKLIRINNTLTKEGSTIATKEVVLKGLQEENAKLAADVAKYKERQDLQQKLDDHLKKKPWLEFEEVRRKVSEKKEEQNVAQKALEAAQATLAPLKDKIKSFKEEVTKTDKDADKQLEMLKRMDTQRRAYVSKDTGLAEAILSLESEVDDVKNKVKRREKEIATIRANIDTRKEKLAEIPASKDEKKIEADLIKGIKELQAKIIAGESAMADARDKVKEADRAHDALAATLRKRSDSRQVRLNAVFQKHPKARECVNFIERFASASKLQKLVIGPLALEIQVDNLLHARYLEHVISENLGLLFIAQTEKDRATLVNAGFPGRVQYIPPTGQRPRHDVSLESLQVHGITSYLDDILHAPEIVVRTLINSSMLNKMAITEKPVDFEKMKDQVTSIYSVLTPTAVYGAKKSNYGGGISTSVSGLKQANILAPSSNDNNSNRELEQKVAELNQKVLEARAEVERLTKELNLTGLHQQIRELQTKKAGIGKGDQMRKVLSEQIVSFERQLKVAMEVETNVEEEEARIKAKIKQTAIERYENAKKLLEQWKKLTEANLKQDTAIIQKAQMKFKIHQLEAELLRRADETKGLQEKSLLLKEELDALVAAAKAKKKYAEQTCPLDEEAKHLETAIESIEAQINRIYIGNENVISDFERRQKEIVRLDREVKELKANHDTAKEQIVDLRAKWEPLVREMAKNLSNRFEEYIKKINCRGNVTLDDQSPDFDQWGFVINVSFREGTPLQPLDKHVQSGGERSVATMLYLIAMQDLTDCPFRLVDEINQGMDPINERAIFQQIVSASSKPDLPQYFLVTPKLLTGLEYGKETTVLCIFNGPFQPSEWAPSMQEMKHQLTVELGADA